MLNDVYAVLLSQRNRGDGTLVCASKDDACDEEDKPLLATHHLGAVDSAAVDGSIATAVQRITQDHHGND